MPTDSPIWKCFLDQDFWPSRAYIKKIWFFKITFMLDSSLLLPQITSTLDFDLNNPRISWIYGVRYFFWSCCFCNLISFSGIAFSTLSILCGRISSFLFFYFLILPFLLYLAILRRFSILILISYPNDCHFCYC